MAKKKQTPARRFLNDLLHFFTPQRSNNHRPKILHPDSLIYIAFSVVGFFALFQTVRFFPTLQHNVLGYVSTITATQVVEQTNQERAKKGLRPLVMDQKLSMAALAKAQDMLDHQYWSHTSPDGKEPWDFIKQVDYTYKLAGENLARDFHHTQEMIEAWMASPTHRANIINAQYEQIGIAVVQGTLDGFETTLVVQMFGTPQPVAAHQPQSDSAGPIPASGSRQPATGQAATHQRVVAVQPEHPTQITVKSDTHPVLAAAMVPVGRISNSPLFTPLQLTKAFFLGLIIMIMLTLVYDSVVIGHRKTMRLVGQNLGHVILFSGVAFLLIFFKGGMIR